MIVGAACGFGGAWLTGSIIIGALCGIVAGMLMSLIFALMTLGLAVNQVATGLALTILGIGLSGLIGAGFVGEKISPAPHLYIPGLTDIPLVGRILFGEDAFVYLSLALVDRRLVLPLPTRAGLILRAVGDNHASAHALGYPVLRIRMFAVMFGGACAGLAGAYLPLAYTPFFIPGMTAGRGWIALALVVFASWLPGRLVIGAYLFGAVTILQLHAQGCGHWHSLATDVGVAVSRDRHRPGPDFTCTNRRLDRARGARDRVRARPVTCPEARATGRRACGRERPPVSKTERSHEKDPHRGSRSGARHRSRPPRRVRRRQAQGRLHLSRPGRRSRLDLPARARPPRRWSRHSATRSRPRFSRTSAKARTPSARSSSSRAPATS